MGNQNQPNEQNDQEIRDEPIGQAQKGHPFQKDQPLDQAQQLRNDQGLGHQQAPHIRDQTHNGGEKKRVNLG